MDFDNLVFLELVGKGPVYFDHGDAVQLDAGSPLEFARVLFGTGKAVDKVGKLAAVPPDIGVEWTGFFGLTLRLVDLTTLEGQPSTPAYLDASTEAPCCFNPGQGNGGQNLTQAKPPCCGGMDPLPSS